MENNTALSTTASQNIASDLLSIDGKKQWFILRGEMKFGPYDYSSIIRMMQQNEVYEYNYLWAQHLEAWTLLSELPEFSKDRLAILVQDKNFMDEAFNRRTQKRSAVSIPVIAHNDKHLFDGTVLNLSLGGGLILLNDPLLLPNDEVTIYFRQSQTEAEEFKVKTQIIRKNFSKQRINVKSGLHFAVRFLQVQNPGLQVFEKWIELSKK